MVDDEELFRELRRNPRRSVRNQLVERHMGLAVHIARRFSPASTRDEDIQQVAMVALVKAVDRYDPTLGHPFASFAGRTIEGEIKRHFRDSTWVVRVPRGAQELHLAVRKATEELTQQLGRAPSVAEVADRLGVDRDDVVTGLTATAARTVGSLDAGSADDQRPTRQEVLGEHDRGFGDTDDQRTVDALLAGLAPREREIVRLRFFEDMSQSEIAERIGMSQMHVSRLLRRAVDELRSALADD